MTKINFAALPFLRKKAYYLSFSFLLVPFIVYLVLSEAFFKSIICFSVLSLIFLAVLVMLCIKNKDNIKGAIIVGVIIIMSFLSVLHTYFSENKYAEYVQGICGDENRLFSCRVTSEDAGTSGSFYVSISHIDGEPLKRNLTAMCYNYTGNYFKNGTFLNITGKLDMVNREESGYNEWLNGKGVYTQIVNAENVDPDISKSMVDIPAKVKGFFEKRMLAVMRTVTEKPRFERALSLSNAMMFGDKSLLDDILTDNFRKSGLIHILCVSGLHFSVILGGLSVLMRWFVKPIRLRYIVLILAAIFYISVCGFARSSIRAAVMALASAFGLAEAKTDSCTHNLMFAASAICIFDPKAVLDGGFIMSCICCTGIVCSTYISEALCRHLKNSPILNFIVSSFTISFSAAVFLLPYTLTVFDGASVVSALASTVAVLPAQILLVLCWIASFFSVIGIQPVNYVFASTITFLSDFVCGVAEFFAGLRFSYINANLPDISFFIFMLTLTVAAIVTNSKSRAAVVYIYIASTTAAVAAAMLVVSA